jgi:hypothetical protein
MYKHLSCAAFKIKLTTGSGIADMCEKLHDRSRIQLRQKAGVCASALRPKNHLKLWYGENPKSYSIRIREVLVTYLWFVK